MKDLRQCALCQQYGDAAPSVSFYRNLLSVLDAENVLSFYLLQGLYGCLEKYLKKLEFQGLASA